MELAGLRSVVIGLGAKGHSEKIKTFAWWLHTHGGKPTFTGADLLKCYDKLDYARPSAIGPYLAPLVEKKDLLRSAAGYRLAHDVRATLDAALQPGAATVEISNLLLDLPAKLPNLVERKYLDEALTCYRHGAPRAAILMTWNLAYAHLCDHILRNRLADFNARWRVSMPGMHSRAVKVIAGLDDFNKYLKEQEVIDVAKDAGIVAKNVHGHLEIGLKRRNMAAHPNDVTFRQIQVDAFIDDLVTNALLKIL